MPQPGYPTLGGRAAVDAPGVRGLGGGADRGTAVRPLQPVSVSEVLKGGGHRDLRSSGGTRAWRCWPHLARPQQVLEAQASGSI